MNIQSFPIETKTPGHCPKCKKPGALFKTREFYTGHVHLYRCETDGVTFYGRAPEKKGAAK